MEIFIVADDIKLFGIEVKTFPTGIGEAFEALANRISNGYDRSYYGLSQVIDNTIIYKAATEEKQEGEAEKYQYERFIIKKGAYLSITIQDWRKKIDSIKDIFNEMMQDSRFDDTQPCIEWYKDDNEMLCLVKSAGNILSVIEQKEV